jgi:hypothetical protein
MTERSVSPGWQEWWSWLALLLMAFPASEAVAACYTV